MYGRYLDLHEFYNAYVNIMAKKGSKEATEAAAAEGAEPTANSGPAQDYICLLYTSPSPRDRQKSRMPSSA